MDRKTDCDELQIQGLEQNLAVYHLFSCSDQLAAHRVAEGEICMDIPVTSADKPRP